MNPDDTKEEFVNPNADLLSKLRVNKEGAFWFRRRRQPDWTDNYTLYRDKVQLNRLTQRQSVNIPLIKSSVKTLLKDVDEPPMLNFVNLDNNEQAEVFYNSYWDYVAKRNQLILKDIVDKRQVMLFGRSFKFMNIINGEFDWEIVDPQDVLVDRYVDPSDIDSARFIIREHIYLPLASLKTNPKYDNEAVGRLQEFMSSDAGLIRASENQLDWVEKQRRLASLGVIDVFNPILGETYVELNEFFIKEYNDKEKEDEISYVVTAEDMEVIYSAKLDDCIGQTVDDFWETHYPCSTWGDETERTDFWSDGVVDSLRTLNKVLNAWFSQLIENRTLRNFGMNYFNSSLTDEGFTPQTFEPVPWGWYPIPAGDKAMGDQIMRVDIPDLEDTLEDINFIMNLAQQVSAATTTQQGETQQGTNQITLGEVQLALQNAKERVMSMAVYYNAAWEDFGLKYTKMLEAAGDLLNDVTIHKKGRLTKKNYSKTITPKDWYTKQGYKVEVKMKKDQQQADADSLQKLQYSKALMPMNPTLDTIIKQKSLEFADLSATQIAEVLKTDEELMKQQAMMAQSTMGMPGQNPTVGQPPGTPPLGQPQMMGTPGTPQGMPPPMMAH